METIEEKISRDQLAKFKGTVLVSISQLDFPEPSRPVDRKVIERLKRDFEGEGCMNQSPNNRIPAIVDNAILLTWLNKLRKTAEVFRTTSKDNPQEVHLDRDMMLECLHGQHRILAAKEIFHASQKLWAIDLYGEDLEPETKRALREGYSYSAPYASGDIFREIRLCHYNQDNAGEQCWRARLSEHQERYLNIILGRTLLISALDSILHISGLWRTFYVGSLNDCICLGCDEEISCYILLIKTTWTRFLGDNTDIDPYTVESIQSRAPALSKSDYEYIQEGMKSRQLFSKITNHTRRDEITALLLSTKEIIPSLWTLLSDIRYMKQPAKTLKTLLPPSPKKGKTRTRKTLRERFRSIFTKPNGNAIGIQTVSSEETLQLSDFDAFELSYQQLWFCSYRISQNLSSYGSLQLTTLAHQLGFSSPIIERGLDQDPATDLVRNAIHEALKVLRPNETFVLDPSQAKPVINSLKDYLNKILEAPIEQNVPLITVAGSGEPLNRRCGYSRMDNQDLNHLFLSTIYAPLREYQRTGDEISSFYVKRARHIAFFGLLGPRRPVVVNPVRHTTQMHRSVEESTSPKSPLERPHPDVISDSESMDQVDLLDRRVVRFIQNTAVQEVPLEREAVTNQAREYANHGMSLSLIQGGTFFWRTCFDILVRAGHSTVIVSDAARPMPPISGKRRRSLTREESEP